MPIPTPNENENEQEFMDRCMSDDTMQEYENDERLAICKTQIENKNLENIEDSSNEKDVSRDYQKKWVNWVYKPIIDKDKIWIKNHYEKNNLIESLLPLTVSCISIKDIPCKKCYWCKEKYTTFGIY